MQKRTPAFVFAFLFFSPLLFPLSLHAQDALTAPAQTINVVLDVASKGALGALVLAATLWLKERRKERTPDKDTPAPIRYATMVDLATCRTECNKEFAHLRESIILNDRQAEARAKGTHARIDALYKETQKSTRSIGMLIGLVVGQGKAPATLLAATTTTED